MVFPLRVSASAALVLLACVTASAQTPSPLSTLPAAPRLSAVDPDVPALEGAVNPETYRLGPGDVFVVSIGGPVPRQIAATVSADGLLVVPEAGSFPAAGETLAAVSRRVGAELRRRFSNVPTDITLATPRRFTVHVSGAVPRPGRYTVRAAARLEDALTQTEGVVSTSRRDIRVSAVDLGVYSEPPSPDREARPAYRNVNLRHADGTEDRVDLARYLVTGVTEFNPYLYDGDVIHLPTFDPAREGVFVSGAVARRGVYDSRPDDTALAILAVADALAGVRAVRVTRRGADGAPVSVEVPIDDAGTFRVLPRDQVFAIASEPASGAAQVVGAVAYPGTYPIRSGETTLESLVEMAGGLLSDALLRGAYLERRTQSTPEEAREAIRLSPTPAIPSFDSLALGLGLRSDLDFVGRRLLAQETYRTPRLSFDIAAAIEGSRPVSLSDGDRLVIPTDLGLVRVYGQVVRPGFVPFEEGQTAMDYIASTGGLAPAAMTVYRVDAATGLFTEITEEDATAILPGDDIYVARIPTANSAQLESLTFQRQQVELQDRRDRTQARFQLIQTVFSTVGALSTIYFIVDSIRRE